MFFILPTLANFAFQFSVQFHKSKTHSNENRYHKKRRCYAWAQLSQPSRKLTAQGAAQQTNAMSREGYGEAMEFFG